jgi:SPP1 gp7 family putative phage head morphogenesis protein
LIVSRAINPVINNQNDPLYQRLNGYLGGLYSNPDEIVKLTGGVKVYSEMERDAVVHAAIQDRISGTISRDHIITPASEDGRDVQIANAIDKLFKDIDTMDSAAQMLKMAIKTGFSISIPTWNLRNYTLAGVQTLDSGRFQFMIDNRILCETIDDNNQIQKKYIDPNDVMLIKYGQGIYGESQIASAYWSWYFKKACLRNYVIFIDKYACPTTLGKLKEGTELSTEEIKVLLTDMAGIQSNSSAIQPPSLETVILLESQRAAVGTFFEGAIKLFNDEIVKAILSQTASMQGTPGNLGNEQLRSDVRDDIIEGDCRKVEKAFNWLIKQIVDVKFGAVKYPKYEIQKPEDKQTAQRLSIYDALMKNGFELSIAQIREEFALNTPTDNDDAFTMSSGLTPSLFSNSTKLASSQPPSVSSQKTAAYKAKLRRQAIEQEAMLSKLSGKQVRYMIDKHYKPILDKVIKQISKDKTADFIEISKEDLSNLKTAQTNLSIANYLLGRYTIQQRANTIAQAHKIKLAGSNPLPADALAGMIDSIEDWVELDPKQAMAFLSRFSPLGVTERSVIERAIKRGESMSINDIDYLKKQMSTALTRAVESGESLTNWIKDTDSIIAGAGLSITQPYYAEAIYRTNMNAGFGAGYIEDVESSPFTQTIFPAYMYSAILDDRTDPVDASYDGLVAVIDDPIWSSIAPPNHFNCRCQLIAVDKYAIEDGSVSVPKEAVVPTIAGRDGTQIPAMPPVEFQQNFARGF